MEKALYAWITEPFDNFTEEERDTIHKYEQAKYPNLILVRPDKD